MRHRCSLKLVSHKAAKTGLGGSSAPGNSCVIVTHSTWNIHQLHIRNNILFLWKSGPKGLQHVSQKTNDESCFLIDRNYLFPRNHTWPAREAQKIHHCIGRRGEKTGALDTAGVVILCPNNLRTVLVSCQEPKGCIEFALNGADGISCPQL